MDDMTLAPTVAGELVKAGTALSCVIQNHAPDEAIRGHIEEALERLKTVAGLYCEEVLEESRRTRDYGHLLEQNHKFARDVQIREELLKDHRELKAELEAMIAVMHSALTAIALGASEDPRSAARHALKQGGGHASGGLS